MIGQGGDGLFEAQEKLSKNQKILIALVGLCSMLEFWDAYLIGFIMAFLVRPWGLDFGTLGVVLLASGVGAIVGGIAWGALTDFWGRKPVFVASVLITAFASLCLAFTPHGDWLYMALLRVLIGFGTGGFFAQMALLHEFVPPKRRGALTGVVSAITTGGLLLGAFSGAFLVPHLGWRGTFALGALPALLAAVVAFFIPESPRWLVLQGRIEDAKRAANWGLGCIETGMRLPPTPESPPRVNWFEIFHLPRHVITTFLINGGLIAGYYGIVLWSPTLLVQIQDLSPAHAAMLMIGFSLSGIVSRLVAARAADRFGRRIVGGLFAGFAGVCVVLAGFAGRTNSGFQVIFWLPLLLGFVFADGSFSVCALYSTEIWPSRLRGCGAGFSGMAGSIGKVVGPMGLALIAGAHSMVRPAATAAAIVPSFLFLGGCLLVCSAVYLLLGIEARGRTLEMMDLSCTFATTSNQQDHIQ